MRYEQMKTPPRSNGTAFKTDQLRGQINPENTAFLTGPQARLARRLAARLGLTTATARVVAELATGHGGAAP